MSYVCRREDDTVMRSEIMYDRQAAEQMRTLVLAATADDEWG